MMVFVMPILVARTLFKFSLDIIESLPVPIISKPVNYDALRFCDVIMSGVFYFMVVSIIIGFGAVNTGIQTIEAPPVAEEKAPEQSPAPPTPPPQFPEPAPAPPAAPGPPTELQQ